LVMGSLTGIVARQIQVSPLLERKGADDLTWMDLVSRACRFGKSVTENQMSSAGSLGRSHFL
jgi:hypothetical protein